MYTPHVVLRGTYLPGTVRCTSGHRHRYPAYSGSGTLVDALVIYCFADVRVNAYLLGSGPSTLTVIVESSLYAINGDDDEDYGLEQLESRRVAYERALAEGGQFGYEEPLQGYLLPGGGSGPVRLEYSRARARGDRFHRWNRRQGGRPIHWPLIQPIRRSMEGLMDVGHGATGR